MQQQLVFKNDKQVVEFYESQIETYDIIDGFSYWESLYSEYARWINKNLPYWLDNVIELGCGTGLLTQFLKQKSSAVYGFDLCEKFLKKAQYRGGKNFFPHLAEISCLPIRDEFADAVICLNTLDHISDIKSVFSEAKRITKDNGIFLFDITSSWAFDPWSFFGLNGKNAIKSSFSRLLKKTIPYDWQLKVDNNKLQKIRTYRRSPQYIDKILENFGFKIINKRGVHLSNAILPEKIQVNSSSSMLSKINKFCLQLDDKLNNFSCMKNCAMYVLYTCRKI